MGIVFQGLHNNGKTIPSDFLHSSCCTPLFGH